MVTNANPPGEHSERSAIGGLSRHRIVAHFASSVVLIVIAVAFPFLLPQTVGWYQFIGFIIPVVVSVQPPSLGVLPTPPPPPVAIPLVMTILTLPSINTVHSLALARSRAYRVMGIV